jgi:hypothetical protein
VFVIAKHERQAENPIGRGNALQHAGARFHEIKLAGLHLRNQVDLLADLPVGKDGDLNRAAGAIAHDIAEQLHRRVHGMGGRQTVADPQPRRRCPQHRWRRKQSCARKKDLSSRPNIHVPQLRSSIQVRNDRDAPW